MDLQVGVIISTVFMVSFLSYLFISKFLPHGKTFDEMIAEKKRMREEMLGTLKPANNKYSGSSNKKKPKKEVKKKDSPPKVQTSKASQSESEEEEENFEEELMETIVAPPQKPSTVNKRKTKKKNSESEEVEEKEPVRQVTIETSTSPQAGNKNKPQQQPPTQNQASKKKGGKGILLNKNEPILVKDNPVEEAVNHFEEIHPKDAIEIQRTSSVAEEKNSKNFRDNKRAKRETPPVSPKNQPAKETAVVKQKQRITEHAPPTVVDGLVADEASITPWIRDLNRADLTKNQIQVLIEFLLNKQSDTIVKDPTEWSEGKSDMTQKLKKQLMEKEAQLKNEQDALSGMQMKLKDLRAEFNNEKIQHNAALKAHVEQMHNLKAEIKGLQTEIQFLNEKHNNEKQSMTLSFKQMQQKYLQVSENLKAFESLPNVQQIQAENQVLQNEVISKNQQIIELKAFADESRKMDEAYKQKLAESDNKITEMEVRLRKKDESFLLMENEMKQRVQDLASRDSEIQKINNEVVHVKDLLQRQNIEKEQLNQQIDTLHQNNHAEENKIEIRNLQNALDSSKKEIESQRALANDYKMKIEDLTKQVTEAKQLTHKSGGDSFLLNEKMNEMAANHQNLIGEKDKQLAEYKKQIDGLQKVESELSKQIEEQKAKNNDLRMKNWKLVEALQAAQTSSTSKMTSNNSVVHENGIDVKTVKDLISQYFPDQCAASATASDDEKWLKSVLENLKTQIVSNNQSKHSTPPINANHHLNNNNSNSNCHVETTNSSSTKALNGDTNSTTSPSASGDNEIILLQNAQLRTTVEEYKNIISETESMLKNLESRVREQDAYWTKVVLLKDNEIENLKTGAQQS